MRSCNPTWCSSNVAFGGGKKKIQQESQERAYLAWLFPLFLLGEAGKQQQQQVLQLHRNQGRNTKIHGIKLGQHKELASHQFWQLMNKLQALWISLMLDTLLECIHKQPVNGERELSKRRFWPTWNEPVINARMTNRKTVSIVLPVHGNRKKQKMPATAKSNAWVFFLPKRSMIAAVNRIPGSSAADVMKTSK